MVETSQAQGPPLLATCQNIQPDVRVTRLNSDRYFTTWGSVWGEVGQAATTDVPRIIATEASAPLRGEREPYGTFASNIAIRSGDAFSDAIQQHDRYQGRRLNRLGDQPPGFCRAFQAPREQVVAAVGRAMAALEHEVTRANPQEGVFETAFLDGEHRTAIWMDRYRATVEVLDAGYVGVRVRRQVFISRKSLAGETGTVYSQGISAGHGEAWILTRITDDLRGRPIVSTIASSD